MASSDSKQRSLIVQRYRMFRVDQWFNFFQIKLGRTVVQRIIIRLILKKILG